MLRTWVGSFECVRRVTRSKFARRIDHARFFRGLRKAARAEAKLLSAFLEANKHGTLRLVYDNAVSPPTYGDLFNVIMLGRFLACDGHQVDFCFLDDSERRSDWGDLDLASRNAFLQDQLALAEYLLPASANVHLARSMSEIPSSPEAPPTFTFWAKKVANGDGIYLWAPFLIRTLTLDREQKTLPQGFLLTQEEFGSALASRSSSAPYVAWHVRKALWGEDRDTVDESIVADYSELRTLFPRHEILILSSKNGVEYALGVLARSGLADEIEAGGLRVYGQPEDRFINAVKYLLGAEFYFQRTGGGIGQAAVFSSVPYLYISGDSSAGYVFGLSGRHLVPWANSDQVFAIFGRSAGSVSIHEALAGQPPN